MTWPMNRGLAFAGSATCSRRSLRSVTYRRTWTSGLRLPWRRMRPSRWATSAGRHGASRWCRAMARSWTLVPTPIFSVEPTRTATLAGAAGGEQLGLVPVGLGLVDEPDRVARAGRGRRAGRAVRRRRSSRARGCPGRRTRAAATRAPGTASRPGRRYSSSRWARQMAAIRSAAASVLPGVRLRQADQAQVEGGAAAVAGDLEHVVLFGADRAAADPFGALAEVGDVGEELVGGLDGDGLAVRAARRSRARPCDGTGRLRSSAVLTSAKTWNMRSISGTLRNAGEPALHAEAVAALGGQLDLGDDLAERGGPGVEHLDPGGLQQVGPQVALHHVGLGDRVGDRGRGGERDHALAVAPAQVVDLHVQVGGAHRPVDGGVGDVRGGAQVLVAVRLVDAQVVDAGGLERDARVLGGVELGASAAPRLAAARLPAA